MPEPIALSTSGRFYPAFFFFFFLFPTGSRPHHVHSSTAPFRTRYRIIQCTRGLIKCFFNCCLVFLGMYIHGKLHERKITCATFSELPGSSSVESSRHKIITVSPGVCLTFVRILFFSSCLRVSIRVTAKKRDIRQRRGGETTRKRARLRTRRAALLGREKKGRQGRSPRE